VRPFPESRNTLLASSFTFEGVHEARRQPPIWQAVLALHSLILPSHAIFVIRTTTGGLKDAQIQLERFSESLEKRYKLTTAMISVDWAFWGNVVWWAEWIISLAICITASVLLANALDPIDVQQYGIALTVVSWVMWVLDGISKLMGG
jgi:hypothetical protein